MTKPTEHDAHRAFHESTLGCHGDCEWGEPCTCSHASAPRRPRQPRRPEPRTPHLPPLTRLSLMSAGDVAMHIVMACMLAVLVGATVRVLLIWLT